MSVDLTFRNNQSFVLLYSMSQWAQLYDLTSATLQMQIRNQPGDQISLYAFANFSRPGIRGTISYEPVSQVLTIAAPYADVRTYLKTGVYAHDLTIEIDDPFTGNPILIRDMAAGTLTITDGVTLR